MAKRNLYLKNTPVEEALAVYKEALGEILVPETVEISVAQSLNRITRHAVYAKYCSPLYNAAAQRLAGHTIASRVLPQAFVKVACCRYSRSLVDFKQLIAMLYPFGFIHNLGPQLIAGFTVGHACTDEANCHIGACPNNTVVNFNVNHYDFFTKVLKSHEIKQFES